MSIVLLLSVIGDSVALLGDVELLIGAVVGDCVNVTTASVGLCVALIGIIKGGGVEVAVGLCVELSGVVGASVELTSTMEGAGVELIGVIEGAKVEVIGALEGASVEIGASVGLSTGAVLGPWVTVELLGAGDGTCVELLGSNVGVCVEE
jgi:hypothetical protein